MYVVSIMFQSLFVHLSDNKFRLCCKAYPQMKVLYFLINIYLIFWKYNESEFKNA